MKYPLVPVRLRSFEEYGCERIVCIACGHTVFQSKGSKKLYKCPECGARFIHPKHLSVHLAQSSFVDRNYNESADIEEITTVKIQSSPKNVQPKPKGDVESSPLPIKVIKK
jgi:predicted RNA-binding Zn-ribbon protein involved in translation (DUF1610 family)